MNCFHLGGSDKGGFDGEERQSVSRIGRFSLSRPQSVSSGSRDETKLSAPASGRDLGRNMEGLRVFRIEELKAATKGFSRSLMIGEGGFGCVYRGVLRLSEGAKPVDVAVKQLHKGGMQGHKEWLAEVYFLGVVAHPHLVKLIGYCAEDDERGIQRLLVYELMPNKSLEDHLFSRTSPALPWPVRLRIALGAARGLSYLHQGMDFQLIFRDFKTSNILLDEDFNAKLSDFGLAREGPDEGDDHVSTAVVGTVGYAAPEYLETGRLTAKSDVWSFGVVLYELITGRRSLDRNLPRRERKLLQWVKPYAGDPKKLHIIVDPRLGGEYCRKSAQSLAALADRCVQRQPKSRPAMSEAVEILAEIVEASGGDAAAVPPLRLGSGRRGSSGGETSLFAPFLHWGRRIVGLFGSSRPGS